MTRSSSALLVSLALATTAGCSASTQGSFKIPRGSQLIVNDKPVTVKDDGMAEMSAFGWGGARYKVVRNGKTLGAGTLETKFRPVSIIWPPFGAAYVPKGLVEGKTYDLTKPDKSAAK